MAYGFAIFWLTSSLRPPPRLFIKVSIRFVSKKGTNLATQNVDKYGIIWRFFQRMFYAAKGRLGKSILLVRRVEWCGSQDS
jgi:hypothetical protein